MGCSLWLELTPFCNLDCAFCYNPWRGAAKDAYPGRDRPDWPTIVRRLSLAAHFDYVALSGGEPLLARGLDDIVRSLRACGQVPVITTNGRNATERRLAALAGAGLAGLQIPLLAVEPGMHDALSGRPSWRWAMRAVLLARRMNLGVALTFVATSWNVREFPRVVALAGSLGITDVVFNEVHLEGQAHGKAELEPALSEALTAVEQARSLATGVEIHVRPSSEGFRSAVGTSRAGPTDPWHRIAVDPSGAIKLCNQSIATIANVSDMSSEDLSTLVTRLEAGDLARYRERVTNCACLDDRLGSGGLRESVSRLSPHRV